MFKITIIFYRYILLLPLDKEKASKERKKKKKMEKIQHNFVEIRGLKLHVAEIGTGTGPAVTFLHGFPEIWYSWRHQMIAVAQAGFRAIAFDFRGYGLSEIPAEPEKTTYQDLADDVLGILDHYQLQKVHKKLLNQTKLILLNFCTSLLF